jgi:hypothetical protein
MEAFDATTKEAALQGKPALELHAYRAYILHAVFSP